MFNDGLRLTRFTLTESTPTTTGVIIARYRLTDWVPKADGAQPSREAVTQR